MRESSVSERWEQENREHLESCRGKYIAVTFSAGKDSSACLHLLLRVREQYGFQVGAFCYAYPRHRYLDGVLDPIEAYWKPRVDTFVVERTEVTDDELDAAAARGDDPCRPCQDLRKRELPRIFELAERAPRDTVIASGHSLWDLAGYALNRFTEQALVEHPETGEAVSNRFLEIAQRFYAFLTMPEGYSVFRPMLVLNAPEISRVCGENSLPLLPVPCRYSQQRPKKLLGEYFHRFGFTFSYRGVVDFAQRFLGLPDKSEFERMSREEYLTRRF